MSKRFWADVKAWFMAEIAKTGAHPSRHEQIYTAAMALERPAGANLAWMRGQIQRLAK